MFPLLRKIILPDARRLEIILYQDTVEVTDVIDVLSGTVLVEGRILNTTVTIAMTPTILYVFSSALPILPYISISCHIFPSLERSKPASLTHTDRIHTLIKLIRTVDMLTESSAVMTISLLGQSSPIEALGQSVNF